MGLRNKVCEKTMLKNWDKNQKTKNKILWLLFVFIVSVVSLLSFIKINKIFNLPISINQNLKSEKENLALSNTTIDLLPLKNLEFTGNNGDGTILLNSEVENILNNDKLDITFKINHNNVISSLQEVPQNLFNDDTLKIIVNSLDQNIELINFLQDGYIFIIKDLSIYHDHTIEIILYTAVSFVVILIGLGTFFSIRKLRK